MRVLIIDDENTICLSLEEGLKDLGYSVCSARDRQQGEKLVGSFSPHIVFLDMKLGKDNGLEVLKVIKEMDCDIEVIIMTAYSDVESAVEAMRLGAFDYIKKPFDFEELHIILNKINNTQTIKNKLYILNKGIADSNEAILGRHLSMRDIYKQIDILAGNDVTVLITGETGTGKELVAEAIHSKSARGASPMVKINCGAIPRELVESELFGYEKNAFTGAACRKKGLLELAHRGTIFLDEIGELPIETQSKLLRFLEDRSFKRVGGLEDISVDTRIIAATNVRLEEAIRQKRFREDLYYRLNILPIKLPPLRDRGEDVILLAQFFIGKYSKTFKKSIEGLSKDAARQLMKYSWPGNVRELKNVIERMVILYESRYISIEMLPPEIKGYNESTVQETAASFEVNQSLGEDFNLESEIQKIEIKYINRALDISDGNHTLASKLLGISRFALKRRIEKYNL